VRTETISFEFEAGMMVCAPTVAAQPRSTVPAARPAARLRRRRFRTPKFFAAFMKSSDWASMIAPTLTQAIGNRVLQGFCQGTVPGPVMTTTRSQGMVFVVAVLLAFSNVLC